MAANAVGNKSVNGCMTACVGKSGRQTTTQQSTNKVIIKAGGGGGRDSNSNSSGEDGDNGSSGVSEVTKNSGSKLGNTFGVGRGEWTTGGGGRGQRWGG